MTGSAHSFTGAAVCDGLLLKPGGLRRIRSVDAEAGLVTVEAGCTLRLLNEELARRGLALANMGDIQVQTVAGAIQTGTHGTGRDLGGMAAQVAGLELVLADGSLVTCSADERPDLFAAARVGLGALGVVTAVTFSVEPAFALLAEEQPMPWDEVLDRFDELAAGNHHFEAYWFPHTDRMLTKRNNRTVDDVEPLSRLRGYVEDELLSNTVFGVLNRVGNAAPRTIRPLNQVAARALSARSYSDVSHRVLTSRRRVVFREMEYAVPRAVGLQALAEVRALVESRDWRISFPVEVRHAPADDIWLSTAQGRDTLYLAFHVNAQTDHREYFETVEQVMRSYDGRPHWGKLHTRRAEDLAPAYPCFSDFLELRDHVDPGRLFANGYLDRVLGE
jgi:L-gulonolactone oxidase